MKRVFLGVPGDQQFELTPEFKKFVSDNNGTIQYLDFTDILEVEVNCEGLEAFTSEVKREFNYASILECVEEVDLGCERSGRDITEEYKKYITENGGYFKYETSFDDAFVCVFLNEDVPPFSGTKVE